MVDAEIHLRRHQVVSFLNLFLPSRLQKSRLKLNKRVLSKVKKHI